jgi:hypothetical protein
VIRIPPVGIAAVAVLIALFCFSSRSFAGGVVSNATESALVAAMTGGGTVTFAVDGTISLTSTITVSTNTVIDATGYNVVISGGGAVEILSVNSGVTHLGLQLIEQRFVRKLRVRGDGVDQFGKTKKPFQTLAVVFLLLGRG